MREHDVSWLDIPVSDAVLVDGHEALQHVAPEDDGLFLREELTVVDPALHGAPVQQRCDDPECVLRCSHLAGNELHHVGMLNLLQYQRLALQPSFLVLIELLPARVEQLHSHLLIPPSSTMQPVRPHHSPECPLSDTLNRLVLLTQLLRQILFHDRFSHFDLVLEEAQRRPSVCGRRGLVLVSLYLNEAARFSEFLAWQHLRDVSTCHLGAVESKQLLRACLLHLHRVLQP
mmetsp:Transcript_58371/g.137010  ORF Transcript_58371/g.137010 Transcript_58371/m.137010 type:complete len:231 (+) Transcript_58371:1460-2152(+)